MREVNVSKVLLVHVQWDLQVLEVQGNDDDDDVDDDDDDGNDFMYPIQRSGVDQRSGIDQRSGSRDQVQTRDQA